ncbi:MAG TPA: UDP-N-acetylmuramoyl-L-alanine--D-glutamate ligase, partial [Actinomycetota bacterium]|nr:UDP-N-acetylmuramoyl-L-alanine--D-glutamate ligase [Actinomycetota bacterium]
VETGGHELARGHLDLAVASPGIPPAAPVLAETMSRGVEIISEIELAYQLARCRFAAVTGTNGKTTTTALLASILEEAGVPTAAAGNIGWPLIDAISEVPEGGVIAVEVSSFQLWGIRSFRPEVAVLLNIAEDHTDWHGSVDAYVAAKARITENQTSADHLLVNADDDRCVAIGGASAATVTSFTATRANPAGIGVDGGAIVVDGEPIVAVDDVPLGGIPGLEDAAAAIGAAVKLDVDPRAIARAVKAFRPMGHRFEVVARADDITYIDDSKATNPHATLAALRGLSDVVLIAGGRSKGMDLSVLTGAVPPVTAVVAIGEAHAEVESVFARLVPVERADSMEEAVRLAAKHAGPGGSVLLSPACASLDMYESYAARGEDFARAVRELLGARGTDGD